MTDSDRILYLSRAEVSSVGLAMAEIIDALEKAFVEKGSGRTEMPPKPGIHPGGGDNFIHAMPAYIPAMNSAGVKWVSGFPENNRRGLPYITGLLILNDPETGIPVCVMDCVWITAMRTAAASAVSARFLARPESSVLGILGCGVQGRTHVEAFNVGFTLKKVLAYDTDAKTADTFARDMADRFGIEVVVVDEPKKAVAGCDLVVTAGPILKKPHATIKAGWFEPGGFASLVDFDSYWHPDALAEADLFCTDDTRQLLHYRDMGYFQRIPEIHADLGQLAVGEKTGRRSPEQRCMAANLGLAIDDMAVAPLIYRLAMEKGAGVTLTL